MKIGQQLRELNSSGNLLNPISILNHVVRVIVLLLNRKIKGYYINMALRFAFNSDSV